MNRIELLICTIDDGILKATEALLPPTEGISYLISWQQPDHYHPISLPHWLTQRSDVRVVNLPGRGLSRNRNNALAFAQGDILVIADDDCRYTVEDLENVRRAYAERPEADILLFQALTLDGRPLKPYANHSFRWEKRPRFTYLSSVEITLRRRVSSLRFDNRFGLGCPLACGEEEIFVHSAIEQKMWVEYIPCPIVYTRSNTTGGKFNSNRDVRRARGGLLCRIHGPFSALLRLTKYAFTRRQTPFHTRFVYLKDMIYGVLYVLTHRPLP